jgi:hypothetical protein
MFGTGSSVIQYAAACLGSRRPGGSRMPSTCGLLAFGIVPERGAKNGSVAPGGGRTERRRCFLGRGRPGR